MLSVVAPCSRDVGRESRDWRAVLGCGILWGVPRKVRQLVADLQRADFVLVSGGKGAHRKFRHATMSGSVILSGDDGDDAKDYQEKQVRNAIREASK